MERITDLLLYLLPRYRRENRSYLSVAVAERLKGRLEEKGWPARVIHRDIAR